jgi:hypothetical protein
MVAHLTIRSQDDAARLMEVVRASALRVRDWMASQTGDPLETLRKMKFEPIGFHPVEDRALNFVEQINQTWTFAGGNRRHEATLESPPRRRRISARAARACGCNKNVIRRIREKIGIENMLKHASELRAPDPYFSGAAGFVGCTIEKLHDDMRKIELPKSVPDGVRRCHDALRHAYIYSYFSYDLLTLAAAQTFPCLELALRERIGAQFSGRLDRNGKPRRPPMLDELLRTAKAQGLISPDVEGLNHLRNMFAHGSDAVLNPPMFLAPFELVTFTIRELFAPSSLDSAVAMTGSP